MRYGVVIEKGPNNYGAHVPDLPGCVATGKTIEETERRIREAIRFHVASLRANYRPVPEPSAVWREVEVA